MTTAAAMILSALVLIALYALPGDPEPVVTALSITSEADTLGNLDALRFASLPLIPERGCR